MVNKSKLGKVFFSLSKSELRSFRNYVRSPYFNRREDVIRLFDYLYKQDRMNVKALEKERIFQALFPGEAYQVSKIDYAMSFLFKLIEGFLLDQALKKKELSREVQSDLLLADAYRRLGLNFFADKKQSTARTKIQKSTLRDLNYYQLDMLIELNFYEHQSLQQNSSINEQALSRKLDLYFMAQKIKDACRILVHQNIHEQEYDLGLFYKLVDYLEQHPDFLEKEAISIYYFYYKSFTDSEQAWENFQQFKYLLFGSTVSFSQDELLDIYLMAINFCLRKSNQGEPRYLEELFDIYNQALESRVLIKDEQLSRFTFRNIVKLALKIKKIDWAKQFVEEYVCFLKAEHQSSIASYVQGMITFEEEDYDGVVAALHSLEVKDILIFLDIKLLLLKSYWHQGAYELLDSYLSSFSMYIRRKEIPSYHQVYYRQFLLIMQKVLKYYDLGRKHRQKLYREVELKEKIVDREWLCFILSK